MAQSFRRRAVFSVFFFTLFQPRKNPPKPRDLVVVITSLSSGASPKQACSPKPVPASTGGSFCRTTSRPMGPEQLSRVSFGTPKEVGGVVWLVDRRCGLPAVSGNLTLFWDLGAFGAQAATW